MNIDKAGTRVRCPIRQRIIVPISIKELYIASLENRKLVIIIKTIFVYKR